jgi:hypothetical protein
MSASFLLSYNLILSHQPSISPSLRHGSKNVYIKIIF